MDKLGKAEITNNIYAMAIGLRVMPQRVKKSVRFLLAMAEAVRATLSS